MKTFFDIYREVPFLQSTIKIAKEFLDHHEVKYRPLRRPPFTIPHHVLYAMNLKNVIFILKRIGPTETNKRVGTSTTFIP